MSIKDDFESLIKKESEKTSKLINKKALELANSSSAITIDTFFSDITTYLNNYATLKDSAKDRNLIDEDFFNSSPLVVAKGLIGAKISTADKYGIITETGAYEGHLKKRFKGFEYSPGEVYLGYFPKRVFCINTKKEGEASLVTIRGIEIEDGSILNPDKTAEYFGLNKDSNQQTFRDLGYSIELIETPNKFISSKDAKNKNINMSENCLGYYFRK